MPAALYTLSPQHAQRSQRSSIKAAPEPGCEALGNPLRQELRPFVLPISNVNSTIHLGAGRAVQQGCSDSAAVPLVPLMKKRSFSCDQDPGTNVTVP